MSESHGKHRDIVKQTPGLVAFWEFSHRNEEAWQSHFDSAAVSSGYPLYLRRYGDEARYGPEQWPHRDEASALVFDTSGPFGKALHCRGGYIFAECPREFFDGTPLDIHGDVPFTLMTWAKFTGERHMLAGIWDEGGWDPYRGRRQIALFAGLFASRGLIGHVSTTGAASYPQSTAPGAQFARVHARDGRDFEDGQWICAAMTFDPSTRELWVYLDGVPTPANHPDPVEQSVYRAALHTSGQNPLRFAHPIFSHRAFMMKFNGYSVEADNVNEHRVFVDLDRRRLRYDRDEPPGAQPAEYRMSFDHLRDGTSRLRAVAPVEVVPGQMVEIAGDQPFENGDIIRLTLESRRRDGWQRVGSEITHVLQPGAPFTIGRALGLGQGGGDPQRHRPHGSHVAVDGVAVFNRVLRVDELQGLSFVQPFAT